MAAMKKETYLCRACLFGGTTARERKGEDLDVVVAKRAVMLRGRHLQSKRYHLVSVHVAQCGGVCELMRTRSCDFLCVWVTSCGICHCYGD